MKKHIAISILLFALFVSMMLSDKIHINKLTMFALAISSYYTFTFFKWYENKKVL